MEWIKPASRGAFGCALTFAAAERAGAEDVLCQPKTFHELMFETDAISEGSGRRILVPDGEHARIYAFEQARRGDIEQSQKALRFASSPINNKLDDIQIPGNDMKLNTLILGFRSKSNNLLAQIDAERRSVTRNVLFLGAECARKQANALEATVK